MTHSQNSPRVGDRRALSVRATAGSAPPRCPFGSFSGWAQAGPPPTPISIPPPPAPQQHVGCCHSAARGSPSGWSSWWTHSWPWEGAELLLGKIPPALNLAAPDISIPPPARRHYTHAHTRPSGLAQAARSAGCPLGRKTSERDAEARISAPPTRGPVGCGGKGLS